MTDDDNENTPSIYCGGLKSCSPWIDTVIYWNMSSILETDLYMTCDGAFSCADSHIQFDLRGATEVDVRISAYGSYSLANSVISASGNTKSLSVTLAGHYTGYNTTIICDSSILSSCSVRCYASACKNTYFVCDSSKISCWICIEWDYGTVGSCRDGYCFADESSDSQSVDCPIHIGSGNGDWINYDENKLQTVDSVFFDINSNELVENSICDTNSVNVLDNITTVCDEEYECDSVEMNLINYNIDMNGSMIITANNYNYTNDIVNVCCRGRYSCTEASIFTDTSIICKGENGCEESINC